MKYEVCLPFLWFKRGEVIDDSKLRMMDRNYLVARNVIREVVPKKSPKKESKK